VARQPLRDIAPSLADESGPPLYYLLLHGWIELFGEGQTAVRLLSLLCGVLLVPATAQLARRLMGPGGGLVAAFLVSATPMAVQFSQEARMYTLLPLLTVLAAERLLAWLEDGSRRALLTHALLLAAIFYTHNWGLLVLPAAGAAALLYRGERLRGWVGAALVSLVLYAPWVPILRAQVRDPSYQFIAMVQTIPWWQLPFRSLLLFAIGVGDIGGTARTLLPAPGSILFAAWFLWLLAAPVMKRERRRESLALLLYAAVPLVCAALYSALARPIYLLGRYEILVLPVLIALAGGATAGMFRGRRLAILVAVWVVALTGLSLRYTTGVQRRFPEPLMAGTLAPHLLPGDRIVFCGLYRAAMEYHLRQAGGPFVPASFPPDAASHLGWYYESLYRPDAPALAGAARDQCPGRGTRTWVVATGGATCRVLIGVLDACARLSSPFLDLGVPANQVLLAEPRER
jgi:4-amino-4-deoxy-L-arabinose transferase-like glycosyltransferase